MKVSLIITGKTTDKALSKLIDDYAGRISHYLPFSIQLIPELKNTRGLTEEQQKEREGSELLGSLQTGDWVILLDEHGQEYSSMEFSRFLEKKLSQSARRIVFVIGGPYGFSPEVYRRCNDKVSLSRMTFSHQMIRLLFTEQLYRALTILKGEPYHHE